MTTASRSLRPAVRMRWQLALAALIFLFVCGYRFLTMGGPLGGFDNDHFGHLARAQQALLGERPVRDFIVLSMPLVDGLSIGAQMVIGRTLFAEAVLTIAMLALASAFLFLLASRASGSPLIGATVALIQVAMAPRLYNYPKVLAYGIGIAAIWWYLDRPVRARLFGLAAAGVLAFLFRHDHGAYLGTAAILAVAVAHWPNVRQGVTEVALLGALALALVAPFLVYVQVNGGVWDYFRTGALFAARDSERTNLKRPEFTFDPALPFLSVAPAPVTRPRVNVQWATDVDDVTRASREAAHGLVPRDRRGERVWNYELTDWSRERVKAIVDDPLVVDTYGLDGRHYTVNHPDYLRPPSTFERVSTAIGRVRILPGVLRGDNAIPFLYYLLVAIPLLVFATILTGAHHTVFGSDANRSALRIGVIAALALAMTYGILRGNLAARLADMSEVVGVLAAWLAVVVLARRSTAGRVVARTVVVTVLLLVAYSVDAIESVRAQVAAVGLGQGFNGIDARARGIYRRLAAIPPVSAWDRDAPGTGRLAWYLYECTAPQDRTFLLGHVEEIFFMSGRGFAGGHGWFIPGFFNQGSDERLIVERIRTRHVPVAIVEAEPIYSREYRPDFPIVDAFLRDEYRPVGVADLGDGVSYRILARRDAHASRVYEPLKLPCFRE